MAVAPKRTLRPRQEQLLALLQQNGRMTPSEIWAALEISKQGALDLLNPLMDAGLVVREGTRKSGWYRLASDPESLRGALKSVPGEKPLTQQLLDDRAEEIQ